MKVLTESKIDEFVHVDRKRVPSFSWLDGNTYTSHRKDRDVIFEVLLRNNYLMQRERERQRVFPFSKYTGDSSYYPCLNHDQELVV